MNFKQIEKIIRADGWRLDRTQGSHHHYTHDSKPGLVTISRHSGDIHPKTIGTILKQAGLKK